MPIFLGNELNTIKLVINHILVFLTVKANKIRPEMIVIAQGRDNEFRGKVSEENFEILLKISDQL
jgi:hypothetical protein